jgi:hypothetical protein
MRESPEPSRWPIKSPDRAGVEVHLPRVRASPVRTAAYENTVMHEPGRPAVRPTGGMTIEGGIAVVLAYVFVSIGVIVAFVAGTRVECAIAH